MPKYIDEETYKGPDRRESLVDRRHLGLYGRYIQFIFAKKKRFYVLMSIAAIGWAYLFVQIGIWLERYGISKGW